jgi:hypothetical protein
MAYTGPFRAVGILTIHDHFMSRDAAYLRSEDRRKIIKDSINEWISGTFHVGELYEKGGEEEFCHMWIKFLQVSYILINALQMLVQNLTHSLGINIVRPNCNIFVLLL